MNITGYRNFKTSSFVMPISSSSPSSLSSSSSSSSSSSRTSPNDDDIVLITDGVDVMAVTSSQLLEEDNDVPYFSRSQQSYIDSITSHPNPKADDDDNNNNNNNNAIIFTWDDDDDPNNDNNDQQQKTEEYESATVTTASTTISRSQQRNIKRRSKKKNKKKSKSQHSLDHLKQQVSNLMGTFEEYGWFIPMPDNDSTSSVCKVWSNRMYGADKKKQRKQNERHMLECRIVQLETVLRDDHNHDQDHDCATIVE